MVRVLRWTHPNNFHCEATRALGVDSCDLHSNRTGALKTDVKSEDFLKLNSFVYVTIFVLHSQGFCDNILTKSLSTLLAMYPLQSLNAI